MSVVTPREREKNRLRQSRFQNGSPSKAVQEKMDHVAARVSSGETVELACSEVGWTYKSYLNNRFKYGSFAVQMNLALARKRGTYKPDDLPFDAEFRQRFYGYPTPPHLQSLIEVINEQVRIARKEQTRDRRILILLPPEHAKSTLLEEYMAYRIAMDQAFRGSIVCATQGQARKRLGAISRRLTERGEYAELVDTYGPFRSESRSDSKPWTADHITTIYAPAAQRDYTCQALGWTGSIYGDRQELIVCDDIADLKNQTPAEIDKQWEKLWGEFRSRLVKGGLFVVIGTRMRENDIYSVMEEKGFFTDKVVMPAIVRDPGTLGDDDPGEALWEDNVSMSELLKLRDTDLRMFELMYQQNPLPSVGATFSQEMIEDCFDNDRYIGHIPDGCRVVAGVDPSVNKFTAGVVFAVAPSGMRYLVDVWNEKGLTGEGGDRQAGVVEFIVELCKTYHVQTLCVEDGTWMEYINKSLTLRVKLNELGVAHHGVKVGPASGEAESTVISQLSGLFSHGLISLPGSPQSRQHLAPMVHQFLTWSPDRQHWRKAFDIVKAFRQAEHAARFLANPGKAFIRGSSVADFLGKVPVAG